MAAIAPRPRELLSIAGVLLLTVLPILADRAADVRTRLNQVASALASGSPADAISVFDKSCPQYEQVHEYFQGLADSFDVTNQLEIADEQDTDAGTTLTVDWDLTIADKTSDATEHRNAQITVKLKADDGKWKIVSIAPIDIFNPAIRAPVKHLEAVQEGSQFRVSSVGNELELQRKLSEFLELVPGV